VPATATTAAAARSAMSQGYNSSSGGISYTRPGSKPLSGRAQLGESPSSGNSGAFRFAAESPGRSPPGAMPFARIPGNAPRGSSHSGVLRGAAAPPPPAASVVAAHRVGMVGAHPRGMAQPASMLTRDRSSSPAGLMHAHHYQPAFRR
jgi:hypothetical protein